MNTIRKKSIALALSGVALVIALGVTATPALADNDHHRGWGYGPPGHHKHHPGPIRYYPAPAYYYYAPPPPPVVYVPQPVYAPQPGLTVVFPINLR